MVWGIMGGGRAIRLSRLNSSSRLREVTSSGPVGAIIALDLGERRSNGYGCNLVHLRLEILVDSCHRGDLTRRFEYFLPHEGHDIWPIGL